MNKNQLYKQLGLGILNLALDPEPEVYEESEAVSEAIDLLDENLSSIVSGETLIEFSQTPVSEANISLNGSDPVSGYQAQVSENFLGANASVYIKPSGVADEASTASLVNASFISNNSGTSLGMIKVEETGDTSFLIKVGGAEAKFVNVLQIDGNTNIEVDLLDDSTILYQNLNSNKSAGTFELITLLPSETFDINNASPEELANLIEYLEEAGSSSSSEFNCFDFLN